MADAAEPERTLVLFKPDLIAGRLAGRVLARFEDAQLKIVAARMLRVSEDLFRQHYLGLENRIRSSSFASVREFMRSGPILALVLEGVDAVASVRRIVGATLADQAAPGTIRADFAYVSRIYARERGVAIQNLVHASDSLAEAAREIAVWFTSEDLHDYVSLGLGECAQR
jgi:nucleoside-diphosphate kinase